MTRSSEEEHREAARGGKAETAERALAGVSRLSGAAAGERAHHAAGKAPPRRLHTTTRSEDDELSQRSFHRQQAESTVQLPLAGFFSGPECAFMTGCGRERILGRRQFAKSIRSGNRRGKGKPRRGDRSRHDDEVHRRPFSRGKPAGGALRDRDAAQTQGSRTAQQPTPLKAGGKNPRTEAARTQRIHKVRT